MHRGSGSSDEAAPGRPPVARYWDLARRLGVTARQGKPLREFLDDVGGSLLAFTAADQVEIWLRTRGMVVRHVSAAASPDEPHFTAPWQPPPSDDLEARCLAVLDDGATDPALSDDRHLLLPLGPEPEGPDSFGVVALALGPDTLARLDLPLLAEVVLDLSQAMGVRRANASLRERMKELDFLYRMALIVEQPGTTLDEVVQRIVETVPGAWLHPEHAWVRLEMGDAVYSAGGRPQQGPRLSAGVLAAGSRRGRLDVGYTVELPPMDDGPFLVEEQALIDVVAREIALIIERHEVAEESQKLEEQLEHTERLATIGELAAGIGHELNDPLNNILGYARFIARRQDLPPEVRRDADIVVTSALHARDTIRQLLTFARRMPQQRTELLLGDVVADALPLLAALCAKPGIQLKTELADGLPPVSADPGQLRQVLVNLVSNAAHAMPDGGRVTITASGADADDHVRLVVEDTGIGMSGEEARNAFLPFYTTREHGTGLGLAVVHGIVAAHGGEIHLDTRPGQGSRFEMVLPAAARAAAAPAAAAPAPTDHGS